MAAHVFFNPDIVEQMAARGIRPRRSLPAGVPAAAPAASGFVMDRNGPRARGGAATHVVTVHGNVTITGQQALPATRTTAETEPRTARELVEECDRLRRDNRRLTDEVSRLRAEVDRLVAGPPSATTRTCESVDMDDSARRFALLELD